MDTFCRFPDLKPGDYFHIDPYAGGSIGRVKTVGEPVGSPRCVMIGYVDMSDGREFEGTYNAEHVTKFLRPGDAYFAINAGRG